MKGNVRKVLSASLGLAMVLSLLTAVFFGQVSAKSDESFEITDAMTGTAPTNVTYTNVATNDGSNYNSYSWDAETKTAMGMNALDEIKVYKPESASSSMILTYDAAGATSVKVGNIDTYGFNIAQCTPNVGWAVGYVPTAAGVVDVTALLWEPGKAAPSGTAYVASPEVYLPWVRIADGVPVLGTTWDTYSAGSQWKSITKNNYMSSYINLTDTAPAEGTVARPIQIEYTTDGTTWVPAATLMTKMARGYFDTSDDGVDNPTWQPHFAEQWEAELPTDVDILKVRVVAQKYRQTGDADQPESMAAIENIGIYGVKITGTKPATTPDETSSETPDETSSETPSETPGGTSSEVSKPKKPFTYVDDFSGGKNAPKGAKYDNVSFETAEDWYERLDVFENIKKDTKLDKAKYFATTKDSITNLSNRTARGYLTYNTEGATHVSVRNIGYGANAGTVRPGIGFFVNFIVGNKGIAKVNKDYTFWKPGMPVPQAEADQAKLLFPAYLTKQGVLSIQGFYPDAVNGTWLEWTDNPNWSFTEAAQQAVDNPTRTIQIEYTLNGKDWLVGDTVITEYANGYVGDTMANNTYERYEANLPDGVKQVRVSFDQHYVDKVGTIIEGRYNTGIYEVQIDGMTDGNVNIGNNAATGVADHSILFVTITMLTTLTAIGFLMLRKHNENRA